LTGCRLHFRRLAIALAACLCLCPAGAQEPEDIDDVLSDFEEQGKSTGSVDDVLSGFDEAGPDPQGEPEAAPTSRSWDLRGDASVSAAYNYALPRPEPGEPDRRGLSQLRFQLRPELHWRPAPGWAAKISGSLFYDAAYRLAGRSQFPDQLLRHQESEAEFRETFLRGQLGSQVDIKVGRQILVWGKSDNLRVVDVLNPLDLREPGRTDIEDLRLPVTMLRGDYFPTTNWSLTLAVIPEIRFDKLPVYGSEYYPGDTPAPPEDVPGDGGSHTEYALAIQGVMSGWDLSLHLARLFDDEAYLALENDRAERQHSRLDMAGVAANLAVGNWLLKGELARLDGKRYFAGPGEDFARTDALLGLEYGGFDNVTLSLETALRHLHDYEPGLGLGPTGVDQNTWQTALRFSGDYLRDRLELVLLAVRTGASLDDGGYTRTQLGYELRQALLATVGLVLYHGGKREPFASYADNDHLLLRLQYSF